MPYTDSKMKERRVYFCPYCHNIRVIESDFFYEKEPCNRCDSPMYYVCLKEEFVEKSADEKKQFINNLKTLHPNVSTPTEILLKRLIEYNKVMSQNLGTIKGIMVFYLVLTILGLFITFMNLIS